MKFNDYPIAPELKRSLDKLGFRRPTDIQFKAIPSILKGEDVLAIAQTGTGKTAAFAIPLLQVIHSQKATKKSTGIKCLVLVPTRELAIQIADAFSRIGQFSKVKAFAITGGVEQNPQIEKLTEGVDVVVATPGRIFDLISQGHLKLDALQTLVLDEADHMLDLGFYNDIRQLQRHLPRQRQTLFFSATITEQIKKLAYSLVKNAIRIQLSPKDPVNKNIEHYVAEVGMDDKRYFLERLLRENEDQKVLVFVRTRVRAERVQKALERMHLPALMMHSGVEQANRFETLEQFKQGQARVLIATDVNARGIDIPGVDIVVNYDLPDKPEHYVHRVGRTGRGTRKGKAYSFCAPEEQALLQAIEAYINNPVTRLVIDKAEYATTVAISTDAAPSWRAAMDEVAALEQKLKAKRKKKK
ncbi:MAG TPA: DEAD/DEAH box helicase [Phnomibacter sp.]|nr:DEAD/DEAH box helicase [Phnomibacter sp.]